MNYENIISIGYNKESVNNNNNNKTLVLKFWVFYEYLTNNARDTNYFTIFFTNC